jgi:biotin carboxyl carrier protein
MENELRAERGGKVLEVAAAVGDSVETNQKLVRLG